MICVPPDRARPDLSSILGFDPWGTAPDLAPQGQRAATRNAPASLRLSTWVSSGLSTAPASLPARCGSRRAAAARVSVGIRGDGAAAPGRRRSVRPRASPSSRNPTSIPEACSNSAATPRAPSGSMGPSCEMARYRTVLSNLHILRRWRPAGWGGGIRTSASGNVPIEPTAIVRSCAGLPAARARSALSLNGTTVVKPSNPSAPASQSGLQRLAC
jgi:hypothetical protein